MDRTGELRAQLSTAAVLTDFDGTLSPLVEDPDAAVPGAGAVEVLDALAGRAAVVGVVSGRPVAFLARFLPDERVHLAGLYGLERRDRGTVASLPASQRWLAPVAAAADDLRAAVPAGVVVEAKRLSLTVHHRRAPEAAGVVADLAAEVAARHGLTVRPARRAVEVHPPAAPDKGVVVEELAMGCDAACFVGDDVGDLPAFDALDRLADKGLDVVKVAVETEGTAAEVCQRADVVVDGPAGAVTWLRSLLA